MTYFVFMAIEAAFVDTSSCILEIVEVHMDVLVNLLVMLARVVDAVAPSSHLERMSIIVVLVNETTSAGAVIRSRIGESSSSSRKVSDPGRSR